MIHFNKVLIRTPTFSLDSKNPELTNLPDTFEEGLFLASPSYLEEIMKHTKFSKPKDSKLENTLHKYWLRSISRCTPYGTFAGVFLADITEGDSSLVLGERSHHKRSVRLDMNTLIMLIKWIESQEKIKSQLLFFLNNSLYEQGGEFRYAEYVFINGRRKYGLVSIKKTTYIERILEEAKEGISFEDICGILIKEEKVTDDDAKSFASEIISSQVLISELEVTITGEDPLTNLLEQVKRFKGISDIQNHISTLVAFFKSEKFGVDHYNEIESYLSTIFDKPIKNSLQVDLFLNTECRKINKDLIETIFQQIKKLSCFARKNKNSSIEEFKKRFDLIYERSEVSLVQALDSDTGIGYAGIDDNTGNPSEWIDKLTPSPSVSSNHLNEFDFIKEFSLKKYEDYILGKRTIIEILDEELTNFEDNNKLHVFPDSMYLMGSLFNIVENHDVPILFSLLGVGGPSAANLIGRFTASSNELKGLCSEIVTSEEALNQEAIYAEIVHLPEDRLGNVLLRPRLRQYEIPYLGKSGINEEFQIPIDDIMISINDGKVLLRSKKHNRQIIPRLTTAHNFQSASNLPIYKFLCDLLDIPRKVYQYFRFETLPGFPTQRLPATAGL
ncbi:lantibiotic dehydratase family protein, partial [Pedobacter suwonensis]|uniref:lantibiotic dehydratase family protein n=1 Tax=Pedobacter suwonensis TaxID=332999 RepID=UPI0036A7C6D2